MPCMKLIVCVLFLIVHCIAVHNYNYTAGKTWKELWAQYKNVAKSKASSLMKRKEAKVLIMCFAMLI